MSKTTSTKIKNELLVDYYKFATLITREKNYTSEKQFIDELILVNKIYRELKQKRQKADIRLYKYLSSPSYVKDQLSNFKGRKIHSFFSSAYKKKLILFFKQHKYTTEQQEGIKSAIFNYYIKSTLEKNTSGYDAGKDILKELHERINIINEFKLLSQGFIKSVKNKQYLEDEIKKLEIILNNCANDISILFSKEALPGNTESSVRSLNKFKIGLAELIPELFQVGRKEQYSFNELLLSLYKVYQRDENKIYLPNIVRVLVFMNDHTLAKNEVGTLSKGALRKKIKDLIKKDLKTSRKNFTDTATYELLSEAMKHIHN